MQPSFDNVTDTDVVTSVGRMAYIHCRVNHLGSRVVTWLRQRDGHVLTAGLFSYTTDQRFTSLHAEGSSEWILKITSPQVRDSGIYECQVSTEPKISKSFNLTVLESRTAIDGSKDIHMSAGNNLNLTCTVTLPFEDNYPFPFFWYHNGQVLYPAVTPNDAHVTMDGDSSRLVIHNVKTRHSGNYTCAPENARPSSVSVYVLTGEVPAAMQHGETNSASPTTSFISTSTLTTISSTNSTSTTSHLLTSSTQTMPLLLHLLGVLVALVFGR
ncbi:zwei Ig domain protein zig-8-like [Oratosquilla oratoria]|uniref:zwei Ig domain protein zig-8-like n=1 Tax=Oratosquilla oratoria TaxID=337810 RepID=UPI003F763565